MILDRFKKQIKNLGLYFLASLIPMLVSLVTNPWIAQNMSPTDYAITGYYGAFNVFFGSFVNFYLLHYYTKRFFELSDDDRLVLKATLFKALIFFSLILAGIALLGLYLYTIIFNTNSDIPFSPYAFLSIMALPITGIYNLQLVDYRMERAAMKFFKISISNGMLAVLLSLLFVVVFKLGAFGKLGATLIASLFVFVFVLLKNRNLFKIKFNKVIFIDAIKFCAPLVLAAMLTFFSNGYDKVVLEKTGNLVEMGYYVVGFSIANYLQVFATSINDTFQPDIFQSIVQRNFKKCGLFIIMKLGIISVIVIAFILLAPFVIDLLTAGRYVTSTPFARIISISVITSMLYYSLSQVTVALGYTSITLLNKIIGSVISIVAFTLLIHKWGAIGASWGMVLSYIFFFIGNFVLVSLKYYKENHQKVVKN